MNIKDLSYDDLIKLNKEVILEIGRRNAFTKSSTGVYKNIYIPLGESLKMQNIEDTTEIARAERAIFKLCDLATKNYRVKTRKDGKKYIQVNGSGILADKNEYQTMCDELVSIFLKHLKKEADNDWH